MNGAEPAEDWHRRLSALGPFMAPEPVTAAALAGWTPLPEVCRDPALLVELAGRTRTALARGQGLSPGEVEPRVAASTAQLSLLARVVSPLLGIALLAGRETYPAGQLWLRLEEHRVRVAMPYAEVLAAASGPGRTGGRPGADLMDAVLLPIGDLACQELRLPRGLVLGNTASALRGTVNALAATDPAASARARRLVLPMLDAPALAGAWHWVEQAGEQVWRRRSCCLFYRLPHGGLCGDCSLLDRPRDAGA